MYAIQYPPEAVSERHHIFDRPKAYHSSHGTHDNLLVSPQVDDLYIWRPVFTFSQAINDVIQ
jgi:hypothetical protein